MLKFSLTAGNIISVGKILTMTSRRSRRQELASSPPNPFYILKRVQEQNNLWLTVGSAPSFKGVSSVGSPSLTTPWSEREPGQLVTTKSLLNSSLRVKGVPLYDFWGWKQLLHGVEQVYYIMLGEFWMTIANFYALFEFWKFASKASAYY